MATNPVELIIAARRRIARIAAIRAFVYFLLPAFTAAVLAAALPAVGALTWERLGDYLAPSVMEATRIALALLAGALLVAALLRGWRAWAISGGFVDAAGRIDLRVNAHQQVVTLATLSDPEASESVRAGRSPLFPILIANVNAALATFSPQNEFALEIGSPLSRSSIPAALVAAALGIAMLALVAPPTPLEKTAMELQHLANRIDRTATNAEDHKLAEQIRKTANDLNNPKMPPQQKEQELEQAMRQTEKRESANNRPAPDTGSGQSSGISKQKEAAGKEKTAGPENDQSKGEGPGEGKLGGKGENNGAQQAAGPHQPNPPDKNQGGKSGRPDKIELKSELAKAEAQVQTDQPTAKPGEQPAPETKRGSAPIPGSNPNQQGGSPKNPNQKGTVPQPVLESGAPQSQAPAQKPAGSLNSPGHTQFGDMPGMGNGNWARFYKAGEGPGMSLKDARYVVFRIPQAAPSRGKGKTLTDSERPRATTPYTNAVLAPSSDNAPPDERQLVPPRYRELIR